MCNKLNGGDYLKTYFEGLETHPENVGVMSFMVKCTKDLKDNALVLDLATGPTIYHIIAAARTASTIVLSDMSPELLGFVERWRDGQKDAFNWNPFIKEALRLEASHGIPPGDCLKTRKEKIRKAVEFAIIDIQKPELVMMRQPFDLVQSAYLGTSCASSHASLLDIWKKCVSYAIPGGDIIIIEVCDAESCVVGKSKVDTYNIGYDDQAALVDELGCTVIEKEFFPAEKGHKLGYSGFATFHLKTPMYLVP